MIVSFFPNSDVGLITQKSITMEGAAKTWGAYSSLAKPAQPAAAGQANKPK
jgi:hypothetical protein